MQNFYLVLMAGFEWFLVQILPVLISDGSYCVDLQGVT